MRFVLDSYLSCFQLDLDDRWLQRIARSVAFQNTIDRRRPRPPHQCQPRYRYCGWTLRKTEMLPTRSSKRSKSAFRVALALCMASLNSLDSGRSRSVDQFTATEWTRSTAYAKRVSPKSLRPAGALRRRVSRVAEKEGEEGENAGKQECQASPSRAHRLRVFLREERLKEQGVALHEHDDEAEVVDDFSDFPQLREVFTEQVVGVDAAAEEEEVWEPPREEAKHADV